MKNLHLYPLKTVLRFFDVVPHFMPFAAKGIFRDTANEEAITALKAIIRLVNWDLTDGQIITFIENEMQAYNIKRKEAKVATTSEKDKKHKKQKKEKKEKKASETLKEKAPIDATQVPNIFTPVIWAVLCKEVVQHGCFFDYHDLRVHAAWDIFINQMSQIHRAFCSEALTRTPTNGRAPVLKLNDESVHNALIDFLGQLCKIGHTESARAIHNYIHFATLIQKAQNKDLIWVGNVVINVLLSGLDLAENLSMLEQNTKESDNLFFPMEETEAIYDTKAAAAELRFLPKLTPCFISHPFFQTPFSESQYLRHQQNPVEYQANLRNAQDFLWRVLPQAGIPLSELDFQTPRDSAAKEGVSETPRVKDEQPSTSPKGRKSLFKVANLFRKLNLSDHNLIKSGQSTPVPESPPKGARVAGDSPTGRRNSGGSRPLLTRTSSGRGGALLSPGRGLSSAQIATPTPPTATVASCPVLNFAEADAMLVQAQGTEAPEIMPGYKLYLVSVGSGASTPAMSRNVSSAGVSSLAPAAPMLIPRSPAAYSSRGSQAGEEVESPSFLKKEKERSSKP